jgi:hypothetical protein
VLQDGGLTETAKESMRGPMLLLLNSEIRNIMIFAIISSVIAIPAANLDILPMNENHPAVMHEYIPSESFASSAGVLPDIQQLESLAGQPFEKNWSKLPLKSVLEKNIWPGPYWSTYMDGINHRWDGENSLSPVEKYAKAFGLNAQILANAVSRKSGIVNGINFINTRYFNLFYFTDNIWFGVNVTKQFF